MSVKFYSTFYGKGKGIFFCYMYIYYIGILKNRECSTPLLVTIVSFYSFTKIQGNQLTAPIAFTAITVFTELRSALNTLPETFVDILQALIR